MPSCVKVSVFLFFPIYYIILCNFCFQFDFLPLLDNQLLLKSNFKSVLGYSYSVLDGGTVVIGEGVPTGLQFTPGCAFLKSI